MAQQLTEQAIVLRNIDDILHKLVREVYIRIIIAKQ